MQNKEKTPLKRTITGYVSEYSDCFLFETDETSFDHFVVQSIDELLNYETQDGDIIKITIEKVGNVHDN